MRHAQGILRVVLLAVIVAFSTPGAQASYPWQACNQQVNQTDPIVAHCHIYDDTQRDEVECWACTPYFGSWIWQLYDTEEGYYEKCELEPSWPEIVCWN